MKPYPVLPHFRYAIVGAGAVGLYYGAKLARRHRDVRFLLRSDYEQATRVGVQISSGEGDFSVRGPFFYRFPHEIGPVDAVLIALKATANRALAEVLPPLLGPATWLVTLQNGLGNEEFLANEFRTDRVLGGLCFVGLNRTGPAQVRHLGSGQITLGDSARSPRPIIHDLAREFEDCGIPCRTVNDLQAARWEKLVWNIPFNALCLLTGKPVSQILNSAGSAARVRELMAEVLQAAAACGHPLPGDLPASLLETTKGLGGYRPSTMIDFELGREIELEAIWGEPLRRGQAAGARMPLLAQLYQQLREALGRRDAQAGVRNERIAQS